MASIRTAIELQDNFTNVLYQVIGAVNLGISAMEDLHQTMDSSVDTTSFDGARASINQATISVQELAAAMQQVEPPELSAPAQWQSDNLEIFTGDGIGRFRQEAQSADAMLEQLSRTQTAIARQAYNTNILPSQAFRDMNRMATRIDLVRERIQQIESNPLNMGADTANAELEQLRGQLAKAVQAQDELNQAIQGMDVSGANDAYLRLSQTVGATERYIRDNVGEQGRFNQEISQGTNEANGLIQAIKGAAAAYVTAQTVSSALNLSDQLTSTTARLDMMNDGLQTTQDLQNMIFLSAERARGSYQATADAVSKMGLMAGDAFGSSQEIIAFMEQVNKQFRIAGTEAAGIDAAMLQLTQAMGSGVLRGEEYNSILEQAPNIIQAIADYMEVPKGQLKDMAAEGQITAEIVKAAMFAAADETNAKFESMPKTFEQIWTSFSNTALMAFQPVLERLNEIGNSDGFQSFANNGIEALSFVAGAALEAFDLLSAGAGMVADNWSWLAPIIYGVGTALMFYYSAMLLYNMVTGVSTAITSAKAFAETVHAASLAMSTGATFAATVAQYGLNAALAACPITWIVVGIIAFVAAVYAGSAAVAHFTGVANSGFGVIAGGINVVIQFFANLLSAAITVFSAVGAAAGALGHNMIAAFHNAITSIQTIFYNLLSTAMSVISQIASTLSQLPFVEFDASGLASAADNYAAKAAKVSGNKMEYQDIGAAFSAKMSNMSAFSSGWASDAFAAGAAWGDGVSDSVSGAISDFFGGSANIPKADDYADLSNYEAIAGAGGLDGIGSGVDDIVGNTGAMADALEITGEELKYLRDIAEQEAINRFTTAEIHIEQTNHNTIKNGMDLDGIVSSMTDMVNEAIEVSTEGVHE